MIDWPAITVLLAIGGMAVGSLFLRNERAMAIRDNAAILIGVGLCVAGLVWLWFARGNFPP